MKIESHSKRWLFSLMPVVIFTAWVISPGGTSYAQNLVTAIQAVAKRAVPSVVHIEATEKQSIPNPLQPLENDPLFRHFFGKNPGKIPKSFEREIEDLGSGILIDSRGHILTNGHLVNGATKMTVVLSDGRRYSNKSVRLIGVDAKGDLAVIQIMSEESFPYAAFGDSDKVEVGQWVVAIGHPRGLDQTVTQGIISAKHRRDITDPGSYQDFFQTDAAINPGNSGGPLLNLDGEVIGVNTAIMSQSGGFEGIGFAIPGNMALSAARQLIAHGRVRRGWLGLTIQNLTPKLAHSFGVSHKKGILVANVLKDGPSDRAGIKRGDIILAYQGKAFDNLDALRNEVAAAPIGHTVALTIFREGRSLKVNIRVSSEREEGKALLSSVTERFGIEVKPIAKRDVIRYGLADSRGVVVGRVAVGGPFGRAGIEPGDIILQINRENIAGPDEFGEVLSTEPPGTEMILSAVDHRTHNAAMVEITAL